MSIDDRLREGLRANTDQLLPQVDHELGAVLRRAHRRNRARLAVAGLAAAAALTTIGFLAGASSVDRGQAPPPTNPGENTREPVPLAGYEGSIRPDLYKVPLWGDPRAAGPQALVEIPEGYFTGGGWAIQVGDDEQDAGLSNLSYWYADKVARDPCASATTSGPIGPTARDLVTELTRQPGNVLSDPKPVTIDGNDGFYLTFRLPSDTDLTQCERRAHILWTTAGYRFGGEDPDADADAVTHLWILDVDGQRMIIAATISADEEPDRNAELLEMARDTHFIDPAD